MQHVEHPFPPVVDEHCRTLILGSFPSVASREDGFFYGHPRNRFWPMLSCIFDEPEPRDIPGKNALLLRHHLALWDVIGSCTITGSDDASIRDVVANDLTPILSAAPIERIFCNGKTAHKLYVKQLQENTGIEAMCLPSTSPANAQWKLERLIEAWSIIR